MDTWLGAPYSLRGCSLPSWLVGSCPPYLRTAPTPGTYMLEVALLLNWEHAGHQCDCVQTWMTVLRVQTRACALLCWWCWHVWIMTDTFCRFDKNCIDRGCLCFGGGGGGGGGGGIVVVLGKRQILHNDNLCWAFHVLDTSNLFTVMGRYANKR